MEIWKPVVGYEGLYEVSNLGNVKSLNWANTKTEKNLYLKKQNKGYLQVELVKNGNKKMITVHRLVAMAFVPNPDGFPQVNHKDEDKKNNRAENLEWCNQKYNVSYSLNLHERKRKCKENVKKVTQYSLDNTLIKEWESSRDIFLKTGMSDWSISECCRGKRKTAYGYLWRYSTQS